MGEQPEIQEVRRGEGESVATMWGNMVTAVAAGEVIEVANRFGEVVGVMVPLALYQQLVDGAS